MQETKTKQSKQQFKVKKVVLQLPNCPKLCLDPQTSEWRIQKLSALPSDQLKIELQKQKKQIREEFNQEQVQLKQIQDIDKQIRTLQEKCSQAEKDLLEHKKHYVLGTSTKVKLEYINRKYTAL